MENLLDTPTIDTKSRELCQFIVDQPEFAAARGHIEAFLENAEAQAVYRAWQEKGQELQRMSHEGLQPNDDDIKQMAFDMGMLEKDIEEIFGKKKRKKK